MSSPSSSEVSHETEVSESDAHNYIISRPRTNSGFQEWKKQQANKLNEGRTKPEDIRLKGKSSRNFYHNQNALIDVLSLVDETRRDQSLADEMSSSSKSKNMIWWAINMSFVVNISLLIMKIYAAIISGSLSVLASLADSILDFLSGVILIVVDAVIKCRNPEKYPIGKARLEPLGVMAFACVMGTASLQLITQSISVLSKGDPELEFDKISVILMGVTVAVKALLFVLCKLGGTKSVLVGALADDHFNDVLSNTLGALTLFLGTKYKWYIDPIGAILMSLLIIRNWVSNGYDQMTMLANRSAPPEVLTQLTYIAMHHHEKAMVDRVSAYHFGVNLLVEVDIILPPDMPLKEAHDIGEDLQLRFEALDIVDRAFVHLDWEYSHKADHEHKTLR